MVWAQWALQPRCILYCLLTPRLDVYRVPSSFLQAWITSGGRLEGVVTDRALIDVCLKGSTDWAGGHDGGAKDDIGGAGSKTLL